MAFHACLGQNRPAGTVKLVLKVVVSPADNRASSGVRAVLSPAGKPEVAETFSSCLGEFEQYLVDSDSQQPCSMFLGLTSERHRFHDNFFIPRLIVCLP